MKVEAQRSVTRALAVVGVAAAVAGVLWWSSALGDGVAPTSSEQPMAVGVSGSGERAAAVEGRDEAPRRTTADTFAGTFAGKVTDWRGRRITNAVVVLQVRGADGGWGRHAEVRAGTDGRFMLTATAGGPYRLEARADGYEVTARELDAPAEEVRLRMAWRFELSGEVRDADTGTPIVGARVVAGTETTSGRLGRYLLSGTTPTGEVRLRASHDGYLDTTVRVVLGDAHVLEFDLELSRGKALDVLVVDAETGVPIVHAGVFDGAPSPIRPSSDLGDPIAQLDADGRFVIRVVEGPKRIVTVAAPGYSASIWQFEVRELGAATPVVPLWRSGAIDGEVVDELGNGLPGVRVFCRTRSSWLIRPPVDQPTRVRLGVRGEIHAHCPIPADQTDDDGRFRLEVVPGEPPYALTAALEGFTRAVSDEVLVPLDGTIPWIRLVLHRSATIRGRAVRNGEPCTGGQVGWTHAATGTTGMAWIRPDGRYELKAVRPGTVELTVGRSRDPDHRETLDVEAGEEAEHDLVWTVASSSISGRVSTPDGAPFEGVEVSAHASADTRSARSAADGTFSIEVDAGKRFRVSASSGPVFERVDDAGAGARDVDFFLPRIGILRIRLVEVSTGEPIARRSDEWRAMSWRPAGSAAYRGLGSRVATDGRCDLELPLGVVDLAFHLQRSGFVPRELRSVVVRTEPNSDPLTVELERGLDVEIRFRGGEGSGAVPKGRLLLALRDDQQDAVRGPFPQQGGPSNQRINRKNVWLASPGLLNQMLRIDADATSRVRGLPPGRYSIRAIPDDLVFEPATFVVPTAGEWVELRWHGR